MLARQLKAQGFALILLARGEENLSKLATELEASYHCLDVTDSEAVKRLFSSFSEKDSLYGLVNLVGNIILKPAHSTSDDEWFRTINLNLSSSFFLIREFVKLVENDASIVLMSSAAASYGLMNHEAIAAAKGGVEALVRTAAASYAYKGIRFNAVAAGLVDTPLSAHICSNQTLRKVSESMHALNRIGTPEDIASAVAWLISPAQSWITGSIIKVDGGLSSVKPRTVAKL